MNSNLSKKENGLAECNQALTGVRGELDACRSAPLPKTDHSDCEARIRAENEELGDCERQRIVLLDENNLLRAGQRKKKISIIAVGPDGNKTWRNTFAAFSEWKATEIDFGAKVVVDAASIQPPMYSSNEIRYEDGDERGREAAEYLHALVTGKTSELLPRNLDYLRDQLQVRAVPFPASWKQGLPEGTVRIAWCRK